MENSKASKFDIDIEIKDLLWEFLRKWRVIVIFSLLFAIGLAAYQYRADMQKTDVVVVKKTQEELEKSLSTQDLDEVIAAVALKRQLDEKSEYMQKSELMNINPYAENIVVMQFFVSAEEDKTSVSAVEAYLSYVENGHMAQDIVNLGATDLSVENVDELVGIAKESGSIYINADSAKESIQLRLEGNNHTGTFDVKVIGETAETAEVLASEVQKALSKYSTTVVSNVGGHQLKLVEETSCVVVDQALADKQTWNATAIKTISNNLDSMKNEMLGDQISLYVYKTTVAVEDTTPSTSAQTPTAKKVSVSVKHLVIGAVVGAILGCGIIFALYLLEGALRSAEEVKTLYKVKVLGNIDDNMFRKGKLFGFIDDLIVRLQYFGRKKLTYEQEIQMICANIVIDCKKKDRKKVALVSSIGEEVPMPIMEAIVSTCKEKGIIVEEKSSINYNAEALESAAEMGSVIFIEKKRVSLYDELYKEVALCKENEIDVVGMVVLGV